MKKLGWVGFLVLYVIAVFAAFTDKAALTDPEWIGVGAIFLMSWMLWWSAWR